ncbi:hypothetical protein V5799_005822 [Amblyomma americanum]|uniref:Peptidase S1 domain-containing protein n=1 Tax=Amblyomma americanum TaxID=6943 RepID=A0AAQ4DY61_AMBAM
MLTVRLGDHDLNSTNDQTAPVDVQVSDLVRHPDYAQNTYTNDIALLVLSEPVTWSRFVQPVCLPFGPLATETLEGSNAFIVGWGATKFGECKVQGPFCQAWLLGRRRKEDEM